MTPPSVLGLIFQTPLVDFMRVLLALCGLGLGWYWCGRREPERAPDQPVVRNGRMLHGSLAEDARRRLLTCSEGRLFSRDGTMVRTVPAAQSEARPRRSSSAVPVVVEAAEPRLLSHQASLANVVRIRTMSATLSLASMRVFADAGRHLDTDFETSQADIGKIWTRIDLTMNEFG